jgi:hypothetical protein
VVIGIGVSTLIGSCSRDPGDDNVTDQPILDIQADLTTSPPSVRIQVHDKPGSSVELGLRLTSGLFEHGHVRHSEDCSRIPLDDQGNGEYALALVQAPADMASALLVELSDGGRDGGVADGGFGQPICPGTALLRSRVLPLGSPAGASVDGAATNADAGTAGDAGPGAADATDGSGG